MGFKDMSVSDKLLRGKVMLQREYPFYSAIIHDFPFKEKEDIPTMAVSYPKKEMYYNTSFVESLDEETLMFVIAHEVLHIVLKTHVRREKRYPDMWNYASDGAINTILKQSGFELPSETIEGEEIKPVYNPEWEGLTAEEIYDKLDKNKNRNSNSGNSGNSDDGDDGDLRKTTTTIGDGDNEVDVDVVIGEDGMSIDNHEEIGEDVNSSADKRNIEDEINKRILKAKSFAEATKSQGSIPAGLDRVFDDLYGEQIDWYTLLENEIIRACPTDYNWSRPSRRSYSTDVYFPRLEKEAIDIAVSIDTSGSVSQKELEHFLSEVVAIVKSFSNVNLQIIFTDAEVQKVVELQDPTVDEIMKVKPAGGGGTDHRPLYKYLEEESECVLVINFTDGWTTWPQTTSIRTITILDSHDKNKDDIPFGKVLSIEV